MFSTPRISNLLASVAGLIVAGCFASGMPTAVGSVLPLSKTGCPVAESGQVSILDLYLTANSLASSTMDPMSREPSRDPEFWERFPGDGRDLGTTATSSFGGQVLPIAFLTHALPMLTRTGWLYQYDGLLVPTPPIQSLLKIPIAYFISA